MAKEKRTFSNILSIARPSVEETDHAADVAPVEESAVVEHPPSRSRSKTVSPVPEVPEPSATPVAGSSRRRNGKKSGKSSNPDYTQMGLYVPKALKLEVDRKLLGNGMDASDLVAALLKAWVDGDIVLADE